MSDCQVGGVKVIVWHWHHHEQEDELFLVISGHLVMKLRERDIHLDAGEFVIIPGGVEHLPIAEQEV
jgi:mannose-6-phosphate isomerase-like protein (cupin superfamily)